MSGDDTFLPPSRKQPPGPLDGDDTFLPPEEDEDAEVTSGDVEAGADPPS